MAKFEKCREATVSALSMKGLKRKGWVRKA